MVFHCATVFRRTITNVEEQQRGAAMTVKEIKIIAKKMGIQPGKMKKADLIRTIQVTEGNTPCFKTGVTDCDQESCCWRSDCT